MGSKPPKSTMSRPEISAPKASVSPSDPDATPATPSPRDLPSDGDGSSNGPLGSELIDRPAVYWSDSLIARELNESLSIDGKNKIVSGYWAPGDGGGGIFTWIDGEVSSYRSDGGTIFVMRQWGGYWKRIFSGAVNAKWFGAKGDGVTNDQDAIQAALDASHRWSKSGSEVFVPAGTYIHQYLLINDNQTLRGARGTVFKMRKVTAQEGERRSRDNVLVGVRSGILPRKNATRVEYRDFEYDGNLEENDELAIAAYSSLVAAGEDSYHPKGGSGVSFETACRKDYRGDTEVQEVEHAEIHNIYAHDCYRNPFLIRAKSVNASNLRAGNSMLDHLYYVQTSETGNFTNIVSEGYWHGGAIASEGENFTNVIFRNMQHHAYQQDPAFYDRALMSTCISDRRSNQKKAGATWGFGGKFLNIAGVINIDALAEPISDTDQTGKRDPNFITFAGFGTVVSGMHLQLIGRTEKFHLISPGGPRSADSAEPGDRESAVFRDIVVRGARSQFRLVFLDERYTSRYFKMEQVYIEYENADDRPSTVGDLLMGVPDRQTFNDVFPGNSISEIHWG